MNFDCKEVMENLGPHQNSELAQKEKAELRQHFLACPSCQSEHEEMLHIGAILEGLPEPVPPPYLVGRIQKEIFRESRRERLAFFSNPIAHILTALRLGPHPTFVNYTAMLFYVTLTIFLLKMTFFNSPGPKNNWVFLKPESATVRVVPLGSIKRAALRSISIECKTNGTVQETEQDEKSK